MQSSQGGPLYIFRGQDIMYKNIAFLSLKIDFDLTNNVDTDEIPHGAAFHRVFTVYQNTHLGLSNLQRVKY